MRGFHDAIGSNFSCIKVFVECDSFLFHMSGRHCIVLFLAGQVAGSLFTGLPSHSSIARVNEASFSLYLPLGGVARVPFTARIGRYTCSFQACS